MKIYQKIISLFKVLKYRGWTYPYKYVASFLFPRLFYSLVGKFSTTQLKKLLYLTAVLVVLVITGVLALIFNILQALVIIIVSLLLLFLIWLFLKKLLFVQKQLRTRKLFAAVRQGYMGETFTKFSELPVSPHTRAAILKAQAANPEKDLVIGRIDHEIRMCGVYGDILTLPQVSAHEFIERPRFKLDVVLISDLVLVRKDFRGDKENFMNEWHNSLLLYAKANTAPIFNVNEKETIIYKSLVIGRIVRDILMEDGARIMSVQIKGDPVTKNLTKSERLALIQQRGRAHISKCLSESFLLEIEQQLNQMHAAGITGVTPTYGNVIDEYRSHSPYFMDFEGTVFNPRRNFLFHLRRNKDRQKFNERFQRNSLTEESTRQLIDEKTKSSKNWYAPIDFGRGIAINGIWSVDSGTGRWDIIRHIVQPVVAGKRVLDLGSNNGIMPIMMLKNGAREVQGIELSPQYIDSADLVKRIFEWRDIKEYDFTLHQGNMLQILDADWGNFDVVTAFCSLYYLSEEDMGKIVRRSSELAPLMILQANITTRREAADRKSKKSSIEFSGKLLRDNGFSEVKVYRLRGYTRPVLVGKR